MGGGEEFFPQERAIYVERFSAFTLQVTSSVLGNLCSRGKMDIGSMQLFAQVCCQIQDWLQNISLGNHPCQIFFFSVRNSYFFSVEENFLPLHVNSIIYRKQHY